MNSLVRQTLNPSAFWPFSTLPGWSQGEGGVTAPRLWTLVRRFKGNGPESASAEIENEVKNGLAFRLEA